MSLDNIKPLLAEYAHLHAQKKVLDERLKELDKQVRPILVDSGSVQVANYVFSCTIMPGRKTLDKKAMEAAGIDLAPYEKVGAPFTKLTVTEAESI